MRSNSASNFTISLARWKAPMLPPTILYISVRVGFPFLLRERPISFTIISSLMMNCKL